MSRLSIAILFFLALSVDRLEGQSPGGPMQAIRELDRQLESYKVSPHLTVEEEAYNRRLKKEVMVGTFDIWELSKESLSTHWEALSPADRQEFVDLMTQLLQKKAIFSKEQVQTENKPYRVTYQKEIYLNPERDRAEVFSQVYVPSEDVRLAINYRLKLVAEHWKIYDVIVDESSSLIKNYAYQFHAIITKHGYPELIRRMTVKLAELEEKYGGKEEPFPASQVPPPAEGHAVAVAPILNPIPPTPPTPLTPSSSPSSQQTEVKARNGFFSCSL